MGLCTYTTYIRTYTHTYVDTYVLTYVCYCVYALYSNYMFIYHRTSEQNVSTTIQSVLYSHRNAQLYPKFLASEVR